MGGGDEDERLTIFGMVFIILGEAAIIGKPAKGSFHDPSFRQNFEGVQGRAFDDLQAQPATWQERLEPLAERLARITSIDPNQTQPPKGSR